MQPSKLTALALVWLCSAYAQGTLCVRTLHCMIIIVSTTTHVLGYVTNTT